jgi:sigma-B regulation protein RsbU (phosphoserine phosphatase)
MAQRAPLMLRPRYGSTRITTNQAPSGDSRPSLGDNPRMPSDPLFDRILKLSTFDGDSRAALLALHAHFAVDFPGCSLALLLVRDQAPGTCRLAGLIGPDGTEHVPNVDPTGERGELPLFDDVLARHIVESATPRVVAIAPPERIVPLGEALFGPATALAIPLANAGVHSHTIVLGSTLAHRFDQVDLERILLHVNLATSLIVRPIALHALAKESARQRQEIEGLADIQRLLLPDNPNIRGLEHAVHWQPAATAAGDYYELSNLTQVAPAEVPRDGADVWGVIVGDVSGHGAAAAMEAVQFDAILRTYQGDEQRPSPAGAISYANKYFFSRRSRGHFMSVIAALYRPDLRTLSFLSAGHPPLLLRRGSDVHLLGEGDQIPLGVLRDYEYRNNEVQLAPDDTLVLYTDGILEARDARERMFGLDRLRELVAHGPQSPQELRDSVVDAVRTHQQGDIGNDDQTLIVLKVAH